jgi:prepilin-type N-terminal cleavage/methylation domain-containing protein
MLGGSDDHRSEQRLLTMDRRPIAMALRRLRAEDGFTLTELLVASVLGVLVVGVATTVFIAAVHSQPTQTAQGSSVQQARVSAERMVRELRQGKDVYTAAPSQLSFLTHTTNQSCGAASGGYCRVTYTCSTSGTCTRVQARPDGSGASPPTKLVDGLTNGLNVFGAPLSGPGGDNYVTITFQFPGQNGGTGLQVTEGAAMRNVPSS